MPTSNVEPLFTPDAPCAQNPQAWVRLEKELESVISWRATLKRKKEAAEPMVQQFCAHCPIIQECYDIALTGGSPGGRSDYTGIAGGALFQEGNVSMLFDVVSARSTA